MSEQPVWQSIDLWKVIAGGFTGATIAFALQRLAEWLKRPRLTVSVPVSQDRLVGVEPFRQQWPHLVVTKRWGGDADDCRVFLTRLERVGTLTPLIEATTLMPWAKGAGGDRFDAQSIYRGAPRLVDIFSTQEGPDGATLRLTFDDWEVVTGSLPPGAYDARFVVTAKGADSMTIATRLHFDGSVSTKLAAKSSAYKAGSKRRRFFACLLGRP